MKVLTFLVKTSDRLVSRMLLSALFFGVLGAGVTLLVGAEGTRQWPPHQLTYVAMVSIAVFAAYAAGVSVLLRAALHSLVQAVDAAPHGTQVEPGTGTGGSAGDRAGAPPLPPSDSRGEHAVSALAPEVRGPVARATRRGR
jgi:hypothetical protein